MTERDVWNLLATCELTYDGFLMVQGRYCRGLCYALTILHENDVIDEVTKNAMLSKIPGNRDDYVWPWAVKGAHQRQQFCKEQYENMA